VPYLSDASFHRRRSRYQQAASSCQEITLSLARSAGALGVFPGIPVVSTQVNHLNGQFPPPTRSAICRLIAVPAGSVDHDQNVRIALDAPLRGVSEKMHQVGVEIPSHRDLRGILSELPVEGNSGLVCGVESGLAGGADGWAAAGVLVCGGDVADAFVQPNGVVVTASTRSSRPPGSSSRYWLR
jgi:hypothetical protein